MRRALIATLSPASGGVSALQRVAVQLLGELGWKSTLAWYEPYSWSPRLSVPLRRLGRGRIETEARAAGGADRGVAVGAWLPELEFTHYWPTAPWRQLITEHELHLVVAGSCLAGQAFARTGAPFLAWIASDWRGDREQRVATYSWARRILDRAVVRPVVRRLEPRILRRGHVVALSRATRAALDRVAGRPVVRTVLPCPIETEAFVSDDATVVRGRIGFVGRIADPRKQFLRFLAVLQAARRVDASVHALVVGGEPTPRFRREVERLGLSGAVEFRGHVPRGELPGLLATFDVLAVTSQQEGLGIGCLEAMACGSPVVSTRCGGPEEFLAPGVNGELVDSDEEMTRELLGLVGDRERRRRFGAEARRTVTTRYTMPRVREIFARELATLGSPVGPGAAEGLR